MKLANLLHRSVSISLLQSLVVIADNNGTNEHGFSPGLLEEITLSTDFENIGTSKKKVKSFSLENLFPG